MKAGLFICDHVKPKYQPTFGDYPDMFQKLFPEFEWILYDVINGEFPQNLDECEVYLATGSHHSVYEKMDWIDQVKQVIRDIHTQGKYFIGICFGHQLLGEALGGHVGKSSKGWCVGVDTFEVGEQTDWMQPFQSELNMLMMCQDQVLQLPDNAKVLAGNEKCPVGIFQVGDKMMGIQAHPEFSKDYDRLLMETRVDRIGEELVEKGLESLEKEVHANLFHDWVLRFINYQG